MNMVRRFPRWMAAALALASAASVVPATSASAASTPTVTVKVKKIYVVDDLDGWDDCGDFAGLSVRSGATTTNVIPENTKVEYWRPRAFAAKRGTFTLCKGATKTVRQSNLPALAAHYSYWNGRGLFAGNKVSSSALNRFTTKAVPGSKLDLSIRGTEYDYTALGETHSNNTNHKVLVPAVGTSRTQTVVADFGKGPAKPALALTLEITTTK